ncbi:Gti1/Pac2 family-domain-containing protein [Cyathus striatus]|nr:Gti1/Pac2 family-domain-containing protein [Cyathus striatus]
MQRPTCSGLRVRSPSDAHIIFHAVSMGILPIISRRLDTEERRAITSGCVYVWEERGPNAEATGLGIERWTDSIRWGPSRVRDEFLFYHEREQTPVDMDITSDSDTTSPSHTLSGHGPMRQNLIKQTYSVFVDTPRGRRKWHLIAYFTHETLDFLHTIDDFSELATLNVPPGKYRSARTPKGHHRTANPIPLFQPRDIRHCSRASAIVDILAPLSYLKSIPPPRRHPIDETALRSLTSGLGWQITGGQFVTASS